MTLTVLPPVTLLPGDSVAAFRAIFADIITNIVAAAEMLARLRAADPKVVSELCSGPHAIPAPVIERLLRVAEKSLHPALALNGCPSYRALKSAPYSIQAAAIEKGFVEVVTGEGEGDFIRVDLVNLSDWQIKQVISPTGLRTLDEQRAWRRSRAAAPRSLIPADAGLPYEVSRKGLAIFRPVTLSRAQLLAIIQEMESK